MSPTIYRKYKYFHSTVQTAEDGRQNLHFCRLSSDVTSRLISLNLLRRCDVKYLREGGSASVPIRVTGPVNANNKRGVPSKALLN